MTLSLLDPPRKQSESGQEIAAKAKLELDRTDNEKHDGPVHKGLIDNEKQVKQIERP